MNRDWIIQGRLDARLIPQGEEIVRGHGRFLASLGMTGWRILTSPLLRTRQSAELLSHELGGAPITEEPALRELGRGELQGRRKDDLPPDLAEAYRTHKADPWTVRPPGAEAENLTDVAERLRDGLLGRLHQLLGEDRPLAVVTHGSVAKVLVMLLAELPRSFVARIRSKDHNLFHLRFDGSTATVRVLTPRRSYAELDWESGRGAA